ncbi:MAG: hypothetical protein KDA58_04335, partial [Planctomycetaceae bacterium]|nr:hypothetical protein [Planctomycetaceae bacterium]
GQFAFFDPRRWLKRKPNLRVRHPDPGESSTGSPLSAREQARMDQLLQKIQDDGQDSLTAEEQQFLADASRKIRERRG